MAQKFQLLLNSLMKLAQNEPYVAGGIGLILLYLLVKKTKQILFLAILTFIGLSVWFWFSSSAESKNKNAKFQRYQTQKVEKRLNVDENSGQ